MGQLFLNKLQINNFRNLSNQYIEFSNGINCIFGNNGNGKTNLLEAVYYLINRKSFRKNVGFQQLISVESEKPEILFSAAIDEDGSYHSYSGKIESLKSTWYYDSQPVKKKLPLETVFINPFDSYAFHTSSSFRRNWIDSYLSILSIEYKRSLKNFNTSLKFRNNLLSKKPNNFKEQIIANNKQLAMYSIEVRDRRKQFLEELKSYCKLTFKIIFNETHNLELVLSSKLDSFSQEEIEDFYNNSIEKDAIIGHTTTGVHRDDYEFIFDGYNSYEYCSLGQQKMSFLSLLFAYIELFRYKFISYPMVLIDDVSGELDEQRWKNLISYLKAKKFQVLITTANENFKKELEKIEDAKKIFIQNGLINL